VQHRLCEQGQGIRLLLGERGRFRGNALGAGIEGGPLATALIEALPSRGQGLYDQRPHFRLEPSPEDHRAVLVVIHAQGAARVPVLRLPRLGASVYAPPPAHDPLDVGGRARAPYPEQPRFRLRRGHAGQGADLGVGELAASQGFGQAGQRAESARHPDPLSGRAQIEPYPPGEPGGAGAKPRVPPSPGVECADQIEQARGRGVEVRGQLGDLVAEAVQLRGRMLRRWPGDLHGESPPSIERTLHRGFRAIGERPGRRSRARNAFDSGPHSNVAQRARASR